MAARRNESQTIKDNMGERIEAFKMMMCSLSSAAAALLSESAFKKCK
jgi:hypothetical protein